MSDFHVLVKYRVIGIIQGNNTVQNSTSVRVPAADHHPSTLFKLDDWRCTWRHFFSTFNVFESVDVAPKGADIFFQQKNRTLLSLEKVTGSRVFQKTNGNEKSRLPATQTSLSWKNIPFKWDKRRVANFRCCKRVSWVVTDQIFQWFFRILSCVKFIASAQFLSQGYHSQIENVSTFALLSKAFSTNQDGKAVTMTVPVKAAKKLVFYLVGAMRGVDLHFCFERGWRCCKL